MKSSITADEEQSGTASHHHDNGCELGNSTEGRPGASINCVVWEAQL